MARNQPSPSKSSIDLISQASSGRAPEIERMPRPTRRLGLAMRDGIELDTWIWLPFAGDGPYPAILFRTPYQEHVLGWARLDALRYRDAGYAVVFQLIRGVGRSGGHFTFNNPLDRTDGYDTIEWIAAQPWSSGAVGMDGSSYGAITQLSAACAQPPHLRCIVPAVISADMFRHIPRFGGIFSRQHSLGWTQLTHVESLADITPGLWGNAALLAAPAAWPKLLQRPAIDAADGVLTEDRLEHYRDVLNHSTTDAFVQSRTLGPEDYARITVPALFVTGLFDGSMGTQYIWHMFERHAPRDVERWLLIGPWDHGQSYVGGGSANGPWRFDAAAEVDLWKTRLAFFDRYLKGEGGGPPLADRVTSYMLGANRWLTAPAYPRADVTMTPLYLHSDGLANLRDHGRLDWTAPEGEEAPDSFQSDPELPFMPVAANLDPALSLDLRETERQEDVLVYTTAPLDAPLLLHGEFTIALHVAADVPDCDIVCWLAVVPPGGATTMISHGMLRLRYREGYDREVMLVPGEPVEATIEMHHLGHRIASGERLRLLIGSQMFPLLDPNPHDGGPIATAVETRIARETVFHDAVRPSHILLPILTGADIA